VTALVAVETVLLVVLVVLVAGLLRSHAAILRRLGPEAPGAAPAPPAPRGSPAGERPAPALSGVTPDGDAVALAFENGSARPALLAFLTTGCATCAGFWTSLADARLSDRVQAVIVTHGSDRERPGQVAKLAPEGVPVVMSSAAWEQYGVPAAPYFVLVDGTIRGEGVASTWPALASLVSDALDDVEAAARNLDARFAAAGVGPGDPSLYPAGAPASAPLAARGGGGS
jgi:hypothetical protein